MTPRVLPLLAATLAACAVAAAEPPPGRHSGYELMGRDSRAMQDDDAANPAMLWVLEGQALWSRKAGAADRSCADCHGEARSSMKGVAARYPAFDPARGRPVNLERRINQCRSGRQQAPALRYESKELLSLAAYVGLQSRRLPIAVEIDSRAQPFLEAGREAYYRRQGQLNLSCAQCHDDRWDKRLAGNPIGQAHPTGYPLYRLEWQGVGSLARRLRNCLAGIRAQVPDYGADELVDVEFYLMWRARGMRLETPAVRP